MDHDQERSEKNYLETMKDYLVMSECLWNENVQPENCFC